MQKSLRDIALCFAAGSVGALAKSGLIWLCAYFPVVSGLVAHLINAQYPAGVYARIVWGGIAALLFLLPLSKKGWLVRGLIWGLVVAIIQLVAIPLLQHGGVHFALAAWLSSLLLACIWGVATAAVLRLLGA